MLIDAATIRDIDALLTDALDANDFDEVYRLLDIQEAILENRLDA